MTQLRDPDFGTWLRLCFDPPASENWLDDWHWQVESDPFVLTPKVATAHILRLLEAPGALLEMHHDNQIDSGLRYIFDPGCGGDAALVYHAEVPQSDQLELAARIDRLYSEVFAPRCPPVLGHLSEEGGRLAGLAYMFWDIAHLGPLPAERGAFADALLDAMGRTLALPHAGAQEGALHGLGHWGRANEEKTHRIIDDWLARGTPARPELVNYARAARGGCVL